MKIVTLKRIVRDAPDGTFGVFIMDDGYPYFTSLELNWKNNAHDISCIPAGEYICNRIMSPKRQIEVFEIWGVLNRTNIEIHPANSIHDLLGCVGVGSRFGVVETKDNGSMHGIQESKLAFNQFMAMLPEKSFKLVILEA